LGTWGVGSQWCNRLCRRNKKVTLPRSRHVMSPACRKARGLTTELDNFEHWQDTRVVTAFPLP
jgi:hypothetical protein